MYNHDGNYYKMDMNKQYRLEKICFIKFKNLDGLEIDFSEKAVTGIFGANGLGKSTILSCIRCLYQPVYNPRRRKGGKIANQHAPEYSSNAPFGHVFYGNQFINYEGSRIVAEFSDGVSSSHDVIATGLYGLHRAKRWSPGTTAKPVCPVYYINMETCIPVTESKNYSSDRKKRASQYKHIYSKSEELRQAYSSIFSHSIDIQSTTTGGDDALCITKDSMKLTFRDLSAGEQRVLRMLDVLFSAVDNSIVLIDELELTLHPLALDRLISVLNKQAKKKNLQIIFTSHNQDLIERKDIAVRSLFSIGDIIRCEHGYNPQCIQLLRGSRIEKPLTMLMEDAMSKAIITTVLNQLNKLLYVHRIIFGGYDTAFKLACSLAKVDKLTEKIAFVLDGDVVKTFDEKKARVYGAGIIEKPTDEEQTKIAKHFIQYCLPDGEESIESYFHRLIISEDDKTNLIVQAALSVPSLSVATVPPEIKDKERFLKHYKLDYTIANLGYDSKDSAGCEKVIEHVANNHPREWDNFVKEVREWVISHV